MATAEKVRKEENGKLNPKLDSDKEFSENLDAVDELQDELDRLNEKASNEILEVERKYNKLRKPLFTKRASVIENIPHFWATVFVNHPQVSEKLTSEDEQVLHYLKNVEVEEYDDIKSGYKIHFHFESNPYFENDVLTKANQMDNEKQSVASSSTIKWKEGKNLVDRQEGKQKGDGKKRVYSDDPSFFNWFSESAADDEEYYDLIGDLIKDDIWPNPLQFFMQGADSEGGDSEDDMDGEGEEDDVGESDEGEGEGDDGEGEDDEPDD